LVISLAVLGNLSLDEVIKSKDYVLALAAKPLLGDLGFKIMAVIALLATASAINATLYAATEIGYTLAKDGVLPDEYEFRVHNSTEGLLISAGLIIPMILFFNLSQITNIAALSVLIIQGIVHLGHMKVWNKTDSNKFLIFMAFLSMFAVVILTIWYNSKNNMNIIYYLIGSFVLAFIFEYLFRIFLNRKVIKQCVR
jgi:amino acid transporter